MLPTNFKYWCRPIFKHCCRPILSIGADQSSEALIYHHCLSHKHKEEYKQTIFWQLWSFQLASNSTGTILVECIKENTFDFEETVEDAYLRTYTKETTSLMDPRFWSTHFTAMRFGRGYTLRFPWNPSADFDQVILLLGHSMEYTIFIHDHEYFMVSENLLALSTLNVAFNPNQTFSHYERLLVTENQLLENCETEPGYSFQSCVNQVEVLNQMNAV